MNKLHPILFVLSLFMVISSASASEAKSQVHVLKGVVLVTQGKNPAHKVVNNEAIATNTLISTGSESAALIKFEDGQSITMQSNSSLKVRKYFYDSKKIEKSSIVLSMFKGGMRFITGLIGQKRKQSFRLSTPNATIRIRGTDFMVVMAGNAMYSQVQSGKINLTNATGMKTLGAGQSASLPSSVALISVVSASALPSGIFDQLMSLPVTPPTAPIPLKRLPTATTPSVIPPIITVPVLSPSVISVPVDVLQESSEPAKIISDPVEARPVVVIDKTPIEQEPKVISSHSEALEVEAHSKSGIGLTGKIGTLGYGAELSFALTDSLNARFGINDFVYIYNGSSNSINYDFKLQLHTISVLADWHPFSGRFRTSVGLINNKNKINLAGKPTNGNFDINGTLYPTSQVSSVDGSMSFNSISPYLGIGWGNPVADNKGWGLVSDFGILFQGEPKVDLMVNCTATVPICTQVQTNAEAENTRIQNDLSGFKYWPVISIGLSYQW